MARPRRKTEVRVPERESEFEDTFRQIAAAAGYEDQFHVLNRGGGREIAAAAAALRSAGMPDMARRIERVGYAKVTSAGHPDWSLGHPQNGILIAELKSDRRGAGPTDDQIRWLHHYAVSLRPPNNGHAPGRSHLWSPKHWPAIETQFGLIVEPVACPCRICDWLRARDGQPTIGDEL